MNIALTGGTGFLGRYIAQHLAGARHRLRLSHRPESDRTGFEKITDRIDWMPVTLEQPDEFDAFCQNVDAVVHSALYRPPGAGFRAAADESFVDFVERNVMGSLRLMAAARQANVPRFVFISTCAVHEVILQDRRLDEAHPMWPTSHYGAHKAAIEKFVHSFGLGEQWPICALRPTGIYGVAHPPAKSRWFGIVQKVARGERVESDRGGKEVHAADVAKAVGILLSADGQQIAGQAFNCCDMYVAEQTVASFAKDITGSDAEVVGNNRGPKNQIDTSKLRGLGMEFGGEPLLRKTVEQLVTAAG